MRIALSLFVWCLLLGVGRAGTLGKVTVTADGAPILKGKETLATAKKGDVMDVTEIHGNWYGVLPHKGWVHSKYVKFEKARGKPPATASAQEARNPAGKISVRIANQYEFGLELTFLRAKKQVADAKVAGAASATVSLDPGDYEVKIYGPSMKYGGKSVRPKLNCQRSGTWIIPKATAVCRDLDGTTFRDYSYSLKTAEQLAAERKEAEKRAREEAEEEKAEEASVTPEIAAAAKRAIAGSWKCDAMLLRRYLMSNGTASGEQEATLLAAGFLFHEAQISEDSISLRRGLRDVADGAYTVVGKSKSGVTIRRADEKFKGGGERHTFQILGKDLIGLVVPTDTGGEIVVPMRRIEKGKE